MSFLCYFVTFYHLNLYFFVSFALCRDFLSPFATFFTSLLLFSLVSHFCSLVCNILSLSSQVCVFFTLLTFFSLNFTILWPLPLVWEILTLVCHFLSLFLRSVFFSLICLFSQVCRVFSLVCHFLWLFFH